MITNVNKGICQRRLQEGKACYFVNWTQDGERKYKFFWQPCMMYEVYKILNKQSMISIICTETNETLLISKEFADKHDLTDGQEILTEKEFREIEAAYVLSTLN